MKLAGPRGRALGGVVVALIAAGCGGESGSTSSAEPPPAEVRAVAPLESKSGTAVTGTATFVQTGKEPVRILIRVEKASPGLHGVHVHEKGDCSDAEAKAAGGHFNPGGAAHAGPETASRHAGDLGNIEVREDGTGDLVATSDLLTVTEGTGSVVGRSVVVHAAEDDFKTQPTGNSGARVACGVVALKR